MIPRYSRPEMVGIWEPQTKLEIWFEIEAHACDAQAQLGVIPKEAANAVWERGQFEIDRIDEIERVTKHDVLAFLTNLAEYVGPEARFVHQGMDLQRCAGHLSGGATDARVGPAAGRR